MGPLLDFLNALSRGELLDLAGTLVSLAALFGGFVAIWFQLHSAKELTALRLVVDLAAQYDSPEVQQCRVSLASKLLATPNPLEINDRVPIFFENIAILERKQVLDSRLLYNTFGMDVCFYWWGLEKTVEHLRTTFGDNTWFEEFEKLNQRFLKKLPRSSALLRRDPGALREFLELEVRRSAP